jgi:hypothetical protein
MPGGAGRTWLHDAALATGAAGASLHRISYGGMLVPVLRLLFVCRGGGQDVFGCMKLFFFWVVFLSNPDLYIVVPPLFLLQLVLFGGRAYATALQAVKRERESNDVKWIPQLSKLCTRAISITIRISSTCSRYRFGQDSLKF